MSKTTIIPVIVLLVILMVCKQKQLITDDNLNEIYVDLSARNGIYDLANDVERDFDIISLETNEHCLLGHIKKIVFENEQYYIQDDKKTSIFIFDRYGKFISKLFKQGGGPEEYVNITSFAINGEDIWIYDEISQRLIGYNKNHQKIKDIKLYIPAFNMTIVENDIYIATNWFWYGDESYQLKKVNHTNEEITNFIPFTKIEKDFVPISKNKVFAHAGDSCLVSFSYDNKLYGLTSKGVSPMYKYVFSERFEDVPLSYGEIREENNLIRGLNALYMTQNSIILQFVENWEPQLAVYNKKTKQCKVYSGMLTNSTFGNIHIYSYFINGRGEIISYYDPETLITYSDQIFQKNSIQSEIKKEQFDSILKKTNMADNPIIIKYKLKKNSEL